MPCCSPPPVRSARRKTPNWFSNELGLPQPRCSPSKRTLPQVPSRYARTAFDEAGYRSIGSVLNAGLSCAAAGPSVRVLKVAQTWLCWSWSLVRRPACVRCSLDVYIRERMEPLQFIRPLLGFHSIRSALRQVDRRRKPTFRTRLMQRERSSRPPSMSTDSTR
jgi:hypothetical protein